LNLIEHGISLKKRRIFLSGELEADNADTVMRALIRMADISADPIDLIVNSPGGELYDAFAIYDIMKTVPNIIRTLAIGQCQSAVPLLVAAGSPGFRYSFPNCHFMVHDIWIEGAPDATVEAAAKELRHTKQLRTKYLELMTANTKIGMVEWKKICRKPGDMFFGPNEALKYGIIDNIATKDVWNGIKT